MAKNMAVIEDGIVTNVIYCDDLTPETDTWKDVVDLPVSVGDTYADGKFYCNGKLLLSDADLAPDMAEALWILGVNV